jgi:extracellular matrix protein 14
MITSYGKSSAWTALVNNFDWVFVPSLNPDGYEYSWSNDRLWRKTRQPTPLRFCKGIDLDRSFEYQFDSGTAGNPCSESYAGQEPWQATEAGQLRDWVRNQTASGAEFIAYLDLHSYSQQILYPYSYTCSFQPPTLENLEELALGLAKAMRLASSHGLTYKATAACDGNVVTNSRGENQMLPRLENGGGSALDWFYHEIKVKYAYQIKLRDTGSYGFLLPKEHIVPSGKEVLEAVAYLGRYLLGEIGMLEEGMDLDNKKSDAESPKQSGGEDRVNDSDPIADEPSQDSIQWELRRRR